MRWQSPSLDVVEAGAGGGSIARAVNGVLRVGPDSAGAAPGPVCYGRGGTQPTVTDANVILGYMNPQAIAGGAVLINYAAAAKIFSETLCKELNLSILQAAYGVYQVANAAMMRTIRAVTTERGRMPAEYTLIAFGGSGPIHAADLASALGISTVCIPLFPGLFSSLGLLLADLRYDYVMSIPSLLDQIDVNDLMLKREALLNTARQEVRRDNLDPGRLSFNTSLDMRYRRQSVELTIAMPMDVPASDLRAVLAERFHCEHERLYGSRRPAEPIVSVNLRLKATAPGQNASFAHLGSEFVREARVERNEKVSSRRVYFGELGELSTPIMKRAMLLEQSCEGPVILEEFDTTIVVPPGWRASLGDGLGNVILQTRR
jgi:N-methylhydantoinase A